MLTNRSNISDLEFLLKATAIAAALSFASCSSSGGGGITGAVSTYASSPHNFRLSLADAPNPQLKSVFVNVTDVQVRMSGNGNDVWVEAAQNLGAIDLLTLQNGVTLPLSDLNIPVNATITQVRLVLASQGNYIIESDGNRCDLKTPSEQQTGIKFIINQGIGIDQGYNYAMVADFDAQQSIVLTGNGGCLLKPVLKLKSMSRVAATNPTPSPTPTSTPSSSPSPSPSPSPTPAAGETLATSVDSTQSSDSSGFDSNTNSSVTTIPATSLPTAL